MEAQCNLESLSERVPSDKVIVAKLGRWLSTAERVLDTQAQEVRGLRLQCNQFARGLPALVAQASKLSWEVPPLGYRAPGDDSGGLEEMQVGRDGPAFWRQSTEAAQFKLEDVGPDTRRRWLHALELGLPPLGKLQLRGQSGFCALEKRRESVESALIGLASGLQTAGIARGTSGDRQGALAALSLRFILEECSVLASGEGAEALGGQAKPSPKPLHCASRFRELARTAMDLAGDEKSGLQAIDRQLRVVENTIEGLGNLARRRTLLHAALREHAHLERSKSGYEWLDGLLANRKLLVMIGACAYFSTTGLVYLSGLFWEYREGLFLHASVEGFILAGFRLGFWAVAGGVAVLLIVAVSRHWVRDAVPTCCGHPSRFRTWMLIVANPVVLLPALLLMSLGAAWGLGLGQLHLLQNEELRNGGLRWLYGDLKGSTIRMADTSMHSGFIMSTSSSDFLLIDPSDKSYGTVPRDEIRCIGTREGDCATVPNDKSANTLTSAGLAPDAVSAREQLTTSLTQAATASP